MSNSQIAPAIQEKYVEHSALIAKLATTDYIPSAYQSNLARIDQLTREIGIKKERVKQLTERTKSEFNDVKELERSASKRFFLRLKEGKEGLNKRKIKEETEYLDAFQAEKNEQMSIDTLERELDVAQKANFDLKRRAEGLEQARKRLDELYQELFSGLTKDYPQEDAAEEAVRIAEAPYMEAQERLNHESQVTALLTKADKAMKKVLQYMTQAEQVGLHGIASATHDFNFYDMRELKSAKRHAMDVETFVNEARGYENEVRNIGWLSIPLQDNKTRSKDGELEIYQLITNSTKDCVRYSTLLEHEIESSKKRLADLSTKVGLRNTVLAAKRADLEKIRRRIIEEVHHGILPEQPKLMPEAWLPMPGSSTINIMSPISDDDGLPNGPTSFPSADTASLSSLSLSITSKPPSYPAGGFRSREGSVDAIQVSAPTLPAPAGGVSFPDTPAFDFPIGGNPGGAHNAPQGVPGFRGAGDMRSVGLAPAPPGHMPQAAVPWALNPYAAWTLWNAGNDTATSIRDGDGFTMPEANSPISSQHVPLPAPDAGSPHLEGRVLSRESAGETNPEEKVVAKGFGKLFSFKREPAPGAWDEVAVGEIRLLQRHDTQKIRIIVKSEHPNAEDFDSSLINGAHLAQSRGVGSDRSWIIRLSENDNIAIRFAATEAAHAFKQAFDQLPVSFPKAPEPTESDLGTTPFAMPLGPGDDGPASSTFPSAPSQSAQNKSTSLPLRSGTEPLAPSWPASNAGSTPLAMPSHLGGLSSPVATSATFPSSASQQDPTPLTSVPQRSGTQPSVPVWPASPTCDANSSAV
ncbi:hypothetical protein FRB96_006845 [Tulasnella sp. 330]|nr:hypothetical protein FRB96_006845 [Tulasnella sp. 330]KAG8871658.1 hypothetical protein FRB97_008429 [Tulasnella sp. 331]KAG8884555.1 hypothetical protein FRB98_002342 [Tulasnella sp. 332]